ncbi:MAG TPA: tRNA (N6-isopentenyl adenosine(37)-C2)-methylthiotransferase MiaB [Bacillota bacterium]|nr:tRNA (N6-isopentenyl adenosine(37)-C2)-methylthiotransferase MiaB [Bacillota bacterium]
MIEKTYHIETFGCQMNERDSETLAGMLEELGYGRAEKKDAEVVILNTCSVRENADKRFFGVLGQLKRQRLSNPSMTVAVCGCMMQQQHIIDRLQTGYSWVDLVFGTHNIADFPRLFVNARDERKRITSVMGEAGEIAEGLPAKRQHDFKAFVNIMYGCNNFCSYCIVPYTRGRERSRRPEHIIGEVEQLAASGVKEVMLLGQNVNSYGKQKAGDIGYLSAEEGGPDFAALLRMVDAVEGIERIRFMSSHPKDLSDELIDCFRSCRHLCRQIHLPVQSGSDRVLKAMQRRYDRNQYFTLIKKLREACPEIAISTDIIVGFPGETEEDFKDTLDLVRRVRYDSAFTFLYSIRPGTPAAAHEEQVPEEVKHERFNRLIKEVHCIQQEKSAAYQDRILRVLVEGLSKNNKNMLTGRSDSGMVVDFAGGEELVGRLLDIRITKAQTFSCYGETVD